MAETIHYVTVQLVAPCASYPYGKIEEGYYRLDGDTVVLVNAKGVQRTDKKGKAITHKLRSGETLRFCLATNQAIRTQPATQL